MEDLSFSSLIFPAKKTYLVPGFSIATFSRGSLFSFEMRIENVFHKSLHRVFHGFHLIFNQSPVENRPIVSDVWHRRNLPQAMQMLAPMMRRPQVVSSGGWGCGYADWKVVENPYG
jgi:hypothetical protein